MKIILNEEKFSSLLTNFINEDLNKKHPIYNKIKSAMTSLENLISRDGVLMVNIDNNKEYVVYEDLTLTNLIGKRYCHCRLLKDGKPYGPIYTKPLDLFKMKMY